VIRVAVIRFSADSTPEQREETMADLRRFILSGEQVAVVSVEIDTKDSSGDLVRDPDALAQLATFAFPGGDLDCEDGPDAVEVAEHLARTLAAAGRLLGVDPSRYIVTPGGEGMDDGHGRCG
jgi:hypothetical protein